MGRSVQAMGETMRWREEVREGSRIPNAHHLPYSEGAATRVPSVSSTHLDVPGAYPLPDSGRYQAMAGRSKSRRAYAPWSRSSSASGRLDAVGFRGTRCRDEPDSSRDQGGTVQSSEVLGLSKASATYIEHCQITCEGGYTPSMLKTATQQHAAPDRVRRFYPGRALWPTQSS